MKTKLKRAWPHVVDCKHHSDYKLILTFDDGKIKLVDLKKYLGRGVFKPLLDLNYFKRIKLDLDTITWPKGADIAPETLYEIGIDITPKPAKAQALHNHRQLRKSA